MEPVQQRLHIKSKSLPTVSGCYLMKNKRDEVIYVGKAKNLKSRVSSYFNQSSKNAKTALLVSHICDFTFLLTETEAEAFVLENNLIKKYGPKYNIRLRDDKSYPYVVIDHKEDFPRLQYIRNAKRNKAREVFGPFPVGTNIYEIMRIITKSFQLRDCSLREFKSRKKPCLLYQLKQCTAPCVGLITKEQYKKDLELATNFFKGAGEIPLQELEKRMTMLADKEEFEHAAMIRDHIQVLTSFLESSQQKNVDFEVQESHIDIFSWYQGELEIDVVLLMVRNGVLLGSKNFYFPNALWQEDLSDELISIILQYYEDKVEELPNLLIAPFRERDRSKVLAKALAPQDDIKVVNGFNLLEDKYDSSYGPLASLFKVAGEQAFQNQRVRLNGQLGETLGLLKLQQLLGLKERPIVLECFDVAIWQGTSPTASQIVFKDGIASKKDYRYYHLTPLPEGNNDYAMMKQMLERRIKHGHLPDVMVVDGGLGQVNIFLGVLKDFGLKIPVVGIAKAKTKSDFKSSEITKSSERLIIPGRKNAYDLSRNRNLFSILTQMRDEAHRFSRKLHHKAEQKRVMTSWLDHIAGVGPKTKQRILSSGKNFEVMNKMEASELAREFGISLRVSLAIKEYLNQSSH